MRNPLQRFPWQRVVAVEDLDGKPRRTQRCGLVFGSAGAAGDPALGGEPACQPSRGVAETEAKKMWDGHGEFPAAAGTVLAGDATGSASRVSAMRLCLN